MPNDFKRGYIGMLPLFPGLIAFGLLYGVLARQVGFAAWQTLAMSLIVFAGSAQFTAVGMWASSSAFLLILTTLILNLRHLLLGASLAPYLRGLPRRWKIALAFWLTDESYAVAIAEYQRGTGSHWYFFGASMGVYSIWAVASLIGALLGSAVPDPARYGLDLVFPLTFLGLLFNFLKDRKGVIVALVAGGVALVGAQYLPGKWYVIIAGLLGSGLGLLMEEWKGLWTKS
jgi:4-azaleucine resistance transporter AzlC